MYSALKHLPRRDILLQQAPGAGVSLLVAEAFFKFGSFSLEVVAFLGTWLVIDAVVQAARRLTGTAASTRDGA